MYVITEEGKIYEGLALTPEEAMIFKELGESGEFSARTSVYISQSDCRRLAAYLCSNFILVRRKSLIQEPEINSEEPDDDPVFVEQITPVSEDISVAEATDNDWPT